MSVHDYLMHSENGFSTETSLWFRASGRQA
jgi:hypothetical protein